MEAGSTRSGWTRTGSRSSWSTSGASTRGLSINACLCPPQRSKLLVYLNVDPKDVDVVPGFTRNVTGLGHHGTGDPEVQLRTPRDVERARDLFRASYAAG